MGFFKFNFGKKQTQDTSGVNNTQEVVERIQDKIKEIKEEECILKSTHNTRTHSILTAQFIEQSFCVKSFCISDSMEGILEGVMSVITKIVIQKEIDYVKRPQNNGMCRRFIRPNTTDDLPKYKYQLVIEHFEHNNTPNYYGDSDWYFLTLTWFDDAPDPNQTLQDYINSITQQFEFFKLCKKMTDDQKEFWI